MNTSKARKNQVKVEELFEQLRIKLNAFKVINLDGTEVGQLKDFTLDKNRRLYMVVPRQNQADSPVNLLSSKYIHHVDSANKIVFVDISQEDLKNLPLYQYSNQTEFSESSLSNLNQQQNITKASEAPEEGQIVRLLEERLIINRSRQKIGEVIVRKKLETRFVEVPVKREKLVVEKIASENQQPVEFEQLAPEYFSAGSQKLATVNNSPVASYQSNNLPEQDLANDPSFEDNTSQIVEEEMVRLLEERLVINRKKWKVGEVVARKEIETEIVRVPIRREKLIIEQVGSANKIIAEIDLANGEVAEVSSAPLAQSVPNQNTVVGEFLSPKSASNLLDAIALQRHHGCTKVRIELVVENSDIQETYQKMFDRCSTY